jgi:pimeloyl-ACP methyl ester carboxylesterase
VTESPFPPPREESLAVGELRMSHVLWPAVEGASDAGDTLFLLHGFLDLGWGMAPLAEALRRAGVGAAIYAPDWRGHGSSDWIGPGGYYHFIDYVGDLAEIVGALGRGRVFLIGHSMGGGAASLYAGAFPETIAGLVNIEGMGPPAGRVEDAPERVRAWVDSVRKARSKRRRVGGYATVEEAAARLRQSNANLGERLSLELALRATKETDGGRRVWKFDPLHRTPSPLPYLLEQAMTFWKRITAPVLLVEGEESPWGALPDLAVRRAAFPRRRVRVVPGAGHMIHHDAPDALGAIIAAFLAEVRAGTFEPEGGAT